MVPWMRGGAAHAAVRDVTEELQVGQRLLQGTHLHHVGNAQRLAGGHRLRPAGLTLLCTGMEGPREQRG